MLGSVGLIMLFGFDGALYSLGWLVGFITLQFFIAERLRNAGRFTLADGLVLPLKERPTRITLAVNVLLISLMLLVAQLLGAGVLMQALAGVSYKLGVIITTVGFICYIIFGGMVSVTWLQIVKAAILATISITIGIWVLAKFTFNPGSLLSRAASRAPQGARFLKPGLYLKNTADTVSLGLALVFGGLVYSLAASTNFPVLVLALGWRRFSTTGAVLGVTLGLVSSVVLIILSPMVWPGSHAPIALNTGRSSRSRSASSAASWGASCDQTQPPSGSSRTSAFGPLQGWARRRYGMCLQHPRRAAAPSVRRCRCRAPEEIARSRRLRA
jgi:Na+(H+)/acetate symporter ActP